MLRLALCFREGQLPTKFGGQHSRHMSRPIPAPHPAGFLLGPGAEAMRVSDMPTLDISTDFVDEGGTPGWRIHHAPPTTPRPRYRVGRLVFVMTMLPLLAASLVAAAWSSLILAAGALGGEGAFLAVVALVAGAAAFSIGSLIVDYFLMPLLLISW